MTASLTLDSWYNPSTGVGGPADKTAGFVFNGGAYRSWDYPHLLEALYESDELAAVKVNAVVDDAFAKGWTVEAAGLTPQEHEAVIEFNDRLKIRNAVMDGDKWSRLFGGGAVFIGSNDGHLIEPLRLGGEVYFAQSYERDELYPSRWYSNPLHPKFGRPSHFRLTPFATALTGEMAAGHGKDIHESRFLLFYGASTTKRRRVENLGWGSSVLLRPMTALKQFNGAYALVLSLLADANQNIYKLKGFADLALAGRQDAIEKRIALIDRFRSATHALLMDADDEDFIRSTLALAGVADVLTNFKERLAAAFEMPLTRLLGVSPAGLNATGESDERNWHKQVLSHQEDVVRPALERWMRVVFAARNGPTCGRTPDSFKVKFPALRDVTPREQAEIDSINAQTDEKYHTMGALSVAKIAKARFSAEPTRPVLDDDEIAALDDVSFGETPPEQPDLLSSGIPSPLALPAPAADTEDSELDDEEPDVDADLMAFIAQMNQHHIERCPHGKPNRCHICGIERVRSVSLASDGSPVFDGRWRPIGSLGTALPTTDSDSFDAYNPNQPRAEDGKFGEGSGSGGAKSEPKASSSERRTAVKDHVSKAHAADRERSANSKARLAEAKVEHKAVTKQAADLEAQLHASLGPDKVAKLEEIDAHQQKANVLAERIRATEAGERLYSPEGLAVQRDLPAAKTQLDDVNGRIAKLRDEVGPEAPEHAALRKQHHQLLMDAEDLDREISGHQQVLKTEAKREKAFSELTAAVEAGDPKAIKKAQAKVAKALAESDDEVFDDNPLFNGLHPEEADLGGAFKD